MYNVGYIQHNTYQTSTNSLYIKYRICIMWDTYNLTHTRQVNFLVCQIQNIHNVEYKQCSTYQVNFLFITIQNLYSVAASNLDHLIPHQRGPAYATVQFRMVSVHSEKPIYTPACLRGFPLLPFKWFQCNSYTYTAV